MCPFWKTTGIPERKDGSVCCSLRMMPTTRTTALKTDPFADWQQGDTCYKWNPNGMLAGVRTPDGRTVTFGLLTPSADGCQRGLATPYTVSAGTAMWCCTNGTLRKPTGRSSSRTRPDARNTMARRSRVTL